MHDDPEFYVGWEEAAPMGIARWVKRVAAGTVFAGLVLGGALAASQRTIEVARFEWGAPRRVVGVLRTHPVPHLEVPRPGRVGTNDSSSAYLLVRPLKFGFEPGALGGFEGKPVELSGTRIYRDGQTLLEVVDGSIRPLGPDEPRNDAGSELAPGPVPLGTQTLAGEIVDSKCHYGVMNPGNRAAHRACAIRCLSGGVPPVLVTRGDGNELRHLVIVGRDGRALNREILDLVAEPVEVTGVVERWGALEVLRADRSDFRRLAK